MTRYQLYKESVINNGRKCILYGIRAITFGEEHIRIIAKVSAVTSDKAKLLKLVRRCNKHHLEPVHLKDVVEDEFGKETI